MKDDATNQIPIGLSDQHFMSIEDMKTIDFISPDPKKDKVYLIPNPEMEYYIVDDVIEAAKRFVCLWLRGNVPHPSTNELAHILLTTAIHDSWRGGSLRLNDIIHTYNRIIKQQFVDMMVDDGVFEVGLTEKGDVGYRWTKAGISWRDEKTPYPAPLKTDK